MSVRGVFEFAAARRRAVIVCLLCGLMLAGCRKRPQVEVEKGSHPANAAKWTYYCSETKKWIQAPPQGLPATNPATGKKTLGLALYCPKCQRWHPVPPPPIHTGNPVAFQCPEHKIRMEVTGPVPTGSVP